MPVQPQLNRRVIQRSQERTVGPLRLTGSSGSFSADVHDISIMGIGLIADREYPVGSSFMVESGLPGRKLSAALTAELQHVTRRDDGSWLLGFIFSRFLTLDDLEAMG